jgi:hypothetical protein
MISIYTTGSVESEFDLGLVIARLDSQSLNLKEEIVDFCCLTGYLDSHYLLD